MTSNNRLSRSNRGRQLRILERAKHYRVTSKGSPSIAGFHHMGNCESDLNEGGKSNEGSAQKSYKKRLWMKRKMRARAVSASASASASVSPRLHLAYSELFDSPSYTEDCNDDDTGTGAVSNVDQDIDNGDKDTSDLTNKNGNANGNANGSFWHTQNTLTNSSDELEARGQIFFTFSDHVIYRGRSKLNSALKSNDKESKTKSDEEEPMLVKNICDSSSISEHPSDEKTTHLTLSETVSTGSLSSSSSPETSPISSSGLAALDANARPETPVGSLDTSMSTEQFFDPFSCTTEHCTSSTTKTNVKSHELDGITTEMTVNAASSPLKVASMKSQSPEKPTIHHNLLDKESRCDISAKHSETPIACSSHRDKPENESEFFSTPSPAALPSSRGKDKCTFTMDTIRMNNKSKSSRNHNQKQNISYISPVSASTFGSSGSVSETSFERAILQFTETPSESPLTMLSPFANVEAETKTKAHGDDEGGAGVADEADADADADDNVNANNANADVDDQNLDKNKSISISRASTAECSEHRMNTMLEKVSRNSEGRKRIMTAKWWEEESLVVSRETSTRDEFIKRGKGKNNSHRNGNENGNRNGDVFDFDKAIGKLSEMLDMACSNFSFCVDVENEGRQGEVADDRIGNEIEVNREQIQVDDDITLDLNGSLFASSAERFGKTRFNTPGRSEI